LYSGKRRYFSQYVEKYPLPDIHSAASKAIIETVRKLHQANADDIKCLEKELEIQVAETFDVEPVFNIIPTNPHSRTMDTFGGIVRRGELVHNASISSQCSEFKYK